MLPKVCPRRLYHRPKSGIVVSLQHISIQKVPCLVCNVSFRMTALLIKLVISFRASHAAGTSKRGCKPDDDKNTIAVKRFHKDDSPPGVAYLYR